MVASFPSWINQYVQQENYGEAPETNVAAFPPDVGAPLLRRRSSISQDIIPCEMWLSSSDWEDLRAFAKTTLLDATQQFSWVNPRNQVAGVFQFEGGPPKLNSTFGITYVIQFSLRLISGGLVLPTVLSISPNSGGIGGGTPVTITGTNFNGTSLVTIGGNPATSVLVVNSTTITAVAPAGAAATVNVAVTTPRGTGTLVNGYTYAVTPYTLSYLVVAGAAGGGGTPANGAGGGGGGAGGLRTGTLSVTPGSSLTVTVGAGGTGGALGVNAGGNGSNSVFSSITSTGGGGGGPAAVGSPANGLSGGSGGGASNNGTPGAGTAGQGNNGGAASPSGSQPGGGGGGAGAVGAAATSAVAGVGGAGTSSTISGSSVTYAGGGGGGTFTGGSASAGGAGGGGAGSNAPGNGTAGTANTGGGGGGSGCTNSVGAAGGNGGSGVVILSVPSANYSGVTTGSPVVTTSGSNTILTFNSSGSYTA